jgi:hypothetical protein
MSTSNTAPSTADTSSSSVDPRQAAYVTQIQAQIEDEVQLQFFAESRERRKDSLDNLLESPNFDILTAVLILGKLTLLQSDLNLASTSLKIQGRTNRLMAIKLEAREFAAKIDQYNRETENFLADNTVPDPKNNSFSRDKLSDFLTNMKNYFTDQTQKIQEAEDDFLDAVGTYFYSSGISKILDQMSFVTNMLDNMDVTDLPSSSVFESIKWVEQQAANLLYGSSVGITLPGTGELMGGLLSVQTALAEAVRDITTATNTAISNRIELESNEADLDTEVLTNFINAANGQFATIYRILQLYYEGILDIFTRLRV